MSRFDNLNEVTDLLNSRDALRSRRRRPHHLESAAYRQLGPVYCLTLCARHHGRPFLRSDLASHVVESLVHRRNSGQWAIYAYCLMPDHLHVIARLISKGGDVPVFESAVSAEPARGIQEIVADFKRYTTMQVAWKLGLSGALWQRDFYDHIGRQTEDIEAQCRYVLNNPIRAGLAEDWTEYPWCGILDEWRALE